MSAGEWTITGLLVFALAVSGISGVGVVVMPGFYAKLHYLAPPAVLATAAVAGAYVVAEGFSGSGIKAILIVLLMVISNPILTHAAARAKRVRDMRKEE